MRDLCQLLYVYKGQAQLEIEGQRTTLTESTLQVLPPLCVHGFRFAEDVQGFVVTLAAPLVAHLARPTGLGGRWLERPGHLSGGPGQ
jgi:AraC family transcriptional regulator, transcriptional activator of pobA